MALWKFNVREIQARPGRSALTLLSIVLGVSSVVAVTIATNSTRDAYQQMFLTMTGRSALEVVAAGGGDFEKEVLPKVQAIPGVKAAVPIVQRTVVLRFQEKKATLSLLGVDPNSDKAVRDYELVEGRFFDDEDGVLVSQNYAKSLGLSLNDKVKLLTSRGGLRPKPATIVGLLAAKGVAAVSGGAVFMPIERAEALFTGEGRVDAIHIVLDDDDAREIETQNAIAKILPSGLIVRKPSSRTEIADATIRSSETGLMFATAMTLIVSAFIILNAFLMNVSERRKQLAIMRAIGATRQQMIRLLLTEGLVMGVIGTTLGILVGLASANYMARSMGSLFNVTMQAARITPQPFILATLFGLGVSLGATYFPARKAGRVSPLEGMRPVIAADNEKTPRWITITGIVICIVGLCMLAACILGYIVVELSPWSAIVVLTGLVFLVPVSLAPMANLVYRLLAPVLGTEGRLACRQILRRRMRTTLTIVVLFVAITGGIGLANVIMDQVRDVDEWYRRTVVGDFFLRAGWPDMTSGTSADMPDGLDDKIKAIPGVKEFASVRYLNAVASAGPAKLDANGKPIVDGTSVVIVARKIKDSFLNLDLRSGDPKTLNEKLADDQVILGTVLAQRLGKDVGDKITLETREGSKPLTVAATSNEYMVGGLTLLMERETAKKLFSIEGVSAYVIKADPSRVTEAEAGLRALSDENGLMLQSYSELTQAVMAMKNGIVASLWVILAVGFVVAAFGVVNTLTMNVLEQTREIGLLRIVAMTRAQIRKTIMSQATIIGVIGLGPGIVTGAIMAYLMNMTTLPVLGRAIEFVFHPVLLLGCLVVGLAIVIGAGYLPARRAARLDLLDALHYE